jgi:hypothetical protein
MAPDNRRLDVIAFLALTALSWAACNGADIGPAALGSLKVSTTTDGTDPDLDGYTVEIDDSPARPLRENPQTFDMGGDPGSHTVRLGGVATNCAVAGETTRDINIASGQATAVTFQISCSPSMGTLVITSSTNGISLDPDGYRVELNGFDAGALGVTAELRLNRVAAGAHYVRLAKVADNCRVKDNPRQVSLIGSQ